MKVEQRTWSETEEWTKTMCNDLSEKAQLVLAFGCKQALLEKKRFEEIQEFYPNAEIMVCSTAGEIMDNKVTDGSINLTALTFESTKIQTKKVSISNSDESFDAGEKIFDSLHEPDLVYLMIISDGHIVNGSELTRALGKGLASNTIITGGLAGDGPNFQSTLVGLNEAPSEGNLVGIGFYGKNLKIGHAARGGWDAFGPERMVTRSEGNILHELDGQSALNLYKKYLGDLASELPGSALLFPLSVKVNGSPPLVRTVLATDDENQSMTFAGDIPEGATARMMRSNFDRLIDGASDAANCVMSDFGSFDPDLAILISCAGRKFVLMDRVEEEVERVRDVLSDETAISGFYAYGEISPVVESAQCELHNQTMTITTLKELV